MSVKLIIPSQHYPVTLEEAKHQLGFFHSEEDDYVMDCLVDATAEAENYSGITSLFTTVEQAFDCFPADVFELRAIPFVKLESIKYYDTADVLQTMDESAYRIDNYSEFARVQAVNSWAGVKDRLNAVIIRYVVGYTGVATASSGTNLINMAGHHFSNGDLLIAYSSADGDLPTGITERKPYYVINTTADSFQLSATSGGDSINITTNGTGQFYIGPMEVAREMTRAIKMMLTHFNENRQDYITGTIVQKMPMGSRSLLNQIKPKRL